MKRISFVLFLIVFAATELFASDTYTVDKSHTSVGFKVTHMVVTTVRGKFNGFDASLKFDQNNLNDFMASANIETASIDTDNQKRDDHLRSDDFFNAEQFPEIKFVANKVEKTEDGYKAIGNLTIRDVTRQVEMPFIVNGPVQDPWGNTRIGIEGSTTINRQDYNVRWNNTLDSGGLVVSDDVEIIIEAQFVKDK